MQKNIKCARELNWNDLKFFLEVARTKTASLASRRLGVDYTTVSRRISALEKSLNTLLFAQSKHAGYVLTPDGERLQEHAEVVENAMFLALEGVVDSSGELSGRIRLGCTEGLGGHFLAPHLARFQKKHPQINIDVLAVPHFINLSKREADIAISLERPGKGPYVSSKLCDYRLKLYATPQYLEKNPPITSAKDLNRHAFVSYVEDLTFSEELHYLQYYLNRPKTPLCFTGVLGQYQAALAGQHLSILPCFIVGDDPRLVEVLGDEVMVTNSFWISCHEDLRSLRRVRALWDYLKKVAEQERALLLGE